MNTYTHIYIFFMSFKLFANEISCVFVFQWVCALENCPRCVDFPFQQTLFSVGIVDCCIPKYAFSLKKEIYILIYVHVNIYMYGLLNIQVES